MSDEELIKETMMLDYNQLVMHNVYMIKENKRLENIIKEVREYISQILEYKKEEYYKKISLDYVERILDILEGDLLDKAN